MSSIRMLSEDLIGKIAAGEVVERPAAAVKELVENSLDAGARHVTVEIRSGGIDFFRVTDDGCGIDESDLRMAFERHATSKIRSEKDLDAIGTLGFRGEALASIAAVGRVTLTTRTRERETGLRVQNDGGQILQITEAACAPGTSILVKDLFYNVPVRRDFLKKPAAEANAITDLMTRLVLSRPDVSFRYVSDGKTVFQSQGGGKTESALLAVYGSRVVKTLRRAEGHENGILIRGYVGIGENARSSRGGENFFINGRTMRSAVLSGGLEDACRERVMIGKYPICALYLEMPYESVNVNVHPNKLEVRFRDDQRVRDAVFHVVHDALQDRDAFERPVEMTLNPVGNENRLPEVHVSRQDGRPVLPRNAEVTTGNTVPDIRMREIPKPVYRAADTENVFSGQREAEKPDLIPPVREQKREMNSSAETASAPENRAVRGFSALDAKPVSVNAGLPKKEENAVQEQAEQLSSLPPDLPKRMRVFGALFNTFILIEYEDHLLMVDQHAVHERLLFDRMMKACDEKNAGQEMLVPYIVPLQPKEMAVLEENRELLESLGLTVEPFSEREVAVRSVPVILGKSETESFLTEAIEELENGRTPGAEKKRAAILQTACKHAVKGGEPLPEEVLRSLVEEMIDRKVTPTCPHGRPLVVSVSHTELDKKFKRIQ